MIDLNKEVSPYQSINVTYAALRHIRYVAQEQVAPDVEPDSDLCQEFILDSESLGLTSARYIVDGFTGGDVSNQKKDWLSSLEAVALKYGLSTLFSRVLSHHSESGRLCAYLNELRGESDDPLKPENLEVIERLVLNNNEANFSVADLKDEHLLVLSPLSTDYLIVSLLQRYTQQFLAPTSFSLKPLIVTDRWEWLRLVAMPSFRDRDYSDITRVEVFVENNTTGRTMNASWEAARRFRSASARTV